jgi:hypothetical protein
MADAGSAHDVYNSVWRIILQVGETQFGKLTLDRRGFAQHQFRNGFEMLDLVTSIEPILALKR